MFMAMFNCQGTMNYKAVFVGGCGSKVKNYPTTTKPPTGWETLMPWLPPIWI